MVANGNGNHEKDSVPSGFGLRSQWMWHVVEHRARVQANMERVCGELMARALEHDTSKMNAEEADKFSVLLPRLEKTTYGTPEYTRLLKELGSALDHHYANNSHHPEHFAEGIAGMSLIDVIEMFVDWVAATMKHADGNIYDSIEKNRKRFSLSPELATIFKNTADAMGFKDTD